MFNVGDVVKRKDKNKDWFWLEYGPRDKGAILSINRVDADNNALYFKETGTKGFSMTSFELFVDKTTPLEDFL